MDSDDLAAFHAAVCAGHAHKVSIGNCAIHQWHYRVSPALLARVRRWHAAGQLVHQTWFDNYFDTATRELAAPPRHAELRLRQLNGTSERTVLHREARGEWTLHWQRRVEHDTSEIMTMLRDFHLVGAPTRVVNPLSYADHSVRGVVRDRYTARLPSDRVRWWIEAALEFRHDGQPECFQLRLTVESDPVTEKWDSDDEEVEDHPPPLEGEEEEEALEHPIPKETACRACCPLPNVPTKDDVMYQKKEINDKGMYYKRFTGARVRLSRVSVAPGASAASSARSCGRRKGNDAAPSSASR